MSRPQAKSWDIFCRIVDNFGDIGICWRLSQQLANEHSLQVRLFIDDLSIASKIIIGLNNAQQSQTINNVEICPWSESDTAIHPANIVIETFGCELPDVYVQQMSAQHIQPKKTIWVNLEYLSAENWVSDFHAKPSRHPTLPIIKHFFFPGFCHDTGGLIREASLIAERDAFLSSQTMQDEFWQKLNAKKNTNTVSIRISLFYYPQAPVNNLLLALKKLKKQIDIYLPFNANITTPNATLTDFKLILGQDLHTENLTIHPIPFLSQKDYDRLLWSCDLNFVRGEDSWIRAIWAGKPFIWQPYIQTDETHIKKLNAFLDVYTKEASPEVKSTLYQTHLAWSEDTKSNSQFELSQLPLTESEPDKAEPFKTGLWQDLINHLPALQAYAIGRTKAFATQPDLATKLVIFSENLAGNKV